MNILLDTNIIIHRESNVALNASIGNLYYWIDKLKLNKYIHPLSIEEIKLHADKELVETILVKIESYNIIKIQTQLDPKLIEILKPYSKTENDYIDDHLLNEVYLKRIGLLITEDRKMLRKANDLNIKNKVISIDQFIEVARSKYPEFVNYKMLSVKKKYFGEIDINDVFFNSLKSSYSEFSDWFNKKCNEEAYICMNDNEILGFLYLKLEESENYYDISPAFHKAKRLKVGTFKVESTGFRLGERFIKIIFDNAIQYNVDEIYVTIFEDKEELLALIDLLEKWGFCKHGSKEGDNGIETVYVKKMDFYDKKVGVKKNYPNINYKNSQYYFVPIYPKWHTHLFPDSKLNNEDEGDFVANDAHKYALEKAYISFSFERGMVPGDIVLFYRTAPRGKSGRYNSVITTIGIIDEVLFDFESKECYLDACKNRTVFSPEDLDSFWRTKQKSLLLIKFIYIKSLKKRPILEFLWDNGIIKRGEGPRPFTIITAEEFDLILKEAETDVYNQ